MPALREIANVVLLDIVISTAVRADLRPFAVSF